MSTCFWPNGERAPERWIACPDSKHCCAFGEACLSNHLCFGGKYANVYRGACTDRSWPISECPHICFEGDFYYESYTHFRRIFSLESQKLILNGLIYGLAPTTQMRFLLVAIPAGPRLSVARIWQIIPGPALTSRCRDSTCRRRKLKPRVLTKR